jgi:hypothetical protein
MTSLSVTASATAMSTGAIAPIVASLPVSLRSAATDAASADLVALDGSVGWPERTVEAVQHPARGLMLVQPCPVARGEVPQTSPVPVVIDYPFACNSAVPSAARAFDGWEADAMVEVSSRVSDAADAGRLLLDQLATLRRLGLQPVSLDRLTWASSGYYLRGSTHSGVPLLLSAHVTSGAPPHLKVRGLAPDRAVELTVPDPNTARPAVLVTTTSAGATTQPTLWESSHRAAWRRLHAAVVEALPTTDLTDLRADLALASDVLPAP